MATGELSDRTVQFSIRLTPEVHDRLVELARVAGVPKSTLSAMAIAAGLGLLEMAFNPAGAVRAADVALVVERQARKTVDDVKAAGAAGASARTRRA